jgi:hypothetical protein
VTFVIFVVTPYCFVNSLAYDHNNRKFAQAAKTLMHSSTKEDFSRKGRQEKKNLASWRENNPLVSATLRVVVCSGYSTDSVRLH